MIPVGLRGRLVGVTRKRGLMKALVVYDSAYGNTEKIAQAIASALATRVEVEVHRPREAEALEGFDLVLVGSPTQGFRPTKSIATWLKPLRSKGLSGIKVAAFDTRLNIEHIKSGALRLLVRTGGFAAERIATQLKKAGGNLIVPPEGFFVEDTEGPLEAGELERAAHWGKQILEAC
jgi:flavodoxin